jgi:hypothetical protein
VGLKKITLNHILRQHCNMTLSQAKKSVDDLLAGRELHLTIGSDEAAALLRRKIEEIGGICR